MYSILVVDDSEDFRNLLAAYLTEIPCSVQYALDGEDAIEFYQTGRFDLVIMDIIMPLMDGVDAIRSIRRFEFQTKKLPIPILAISAEQSIETGVDSMDAGATRMLVKPITKEGFLKTVLDLLENPAGQ